MKFILIRHGESQQNIGNAVNIIDSLVPLTEKGIEQSRKAGEFIFKNKKEFELNDESFLFFSPYLRARQTGEIIIDANKYLINCHEEILLTEIQCGDINGRTIKEYGKINPLEYEKFQKYKENKCKFWYRFPNGESSFDVNTRVSLFLQKIAHLKSTVIIVSHIHTLKILQMHLMKEDLQWYENEDGLKNCEIRIIDNCKIIKKIKFSLELMEQPA